MRDATPSDDMMNDAVVCVWAVAAQLGEGPMYAADEHALWFVDIKGQRIHRYDERSGERRSWSTPEPVGFILPATGGRFVCGMKSGLYSFDPGGRGARPGDDAPPGQFALIEPVETDRAHNRLNDGCVDRAGRLWFGTMDDAEHRASGALYRYDARGLRYCDGRYAITNGPAISPDGDTLYHVDTLGREIHAYDLHADGELSGRRLFLRIEAGHGHPDGIAVDSLGHVWIALHGGSRLLRYTPRARLVDAVHLPVSNCTKMAFGGDDLRSLYITSAWNGLSDAQRVREPLAGGLFRIRVEHPGLPQYEARLP